MSCQVSHVLAHSGTLLTQFSSLGLLGTHAQQKWAEQLLSEARTIIDMPSLASGDAMLMRDTIMQNTFTCQPQQRNIHGRVFGGFIMRCEKHMRRI